MSGKPYTNTDVKLLSRAEFEHDMREAGCPDAWEEASSFVRNSYRRRSRAGLDALAAAGRLLPEPSARRCSAPGSPRPSCD